MNYSACGGELLSELVFHTQHKLISATVKNGILQHISYDAQQE